MSDNNRRKAFLRPALLDIGAYRVLDAGHAIKLDAMENPYRWPAELQQAWAETLSMLPLNRYPDAAMTELEEAVRSIFALPESVSLLFGNGSDEVIQILLLSLRLESGLVLAPAPTFVMYRIIAQYIGLPYRGVPLSSDFGLDETAMLAAVRQHNPALIFLACPNNPTGTYYDLTVIERIVEAAPGLVVIDEAYFAFAGESMFALLERYEHVLILRTMSKMGLAGLRLGMLLGAPSWITEFNKLRLPYNINCLSQAAMIFIAGHIDVLEQQIRVLVAERARLFSELDRRDGIKVWPSRANFLLFRSERRPANELHQQLIQSGVLIKNLDGSDPKLTACLRMTVGTAQENDRFLEILDMLLGTK